MRKYVRKSRAKVAWVVAGAPPCPPMKKRLEYDRWRRKYTRPPCDCSNPFFKWSSDGSAICERCAKIESTMRNPSSSFAIYERTRKFDRTCWGEAVHEFPCVF